MNGPESPNQFDRFIAKPKPSEVPMGGTYRVAGTPESDGTKKVVGFEGTRDAEMQEEMLQIKPEGLTGKEKERERNVEKVELFLMKMGWQAKNLESSQALNIASKETGLGTTEISFCAQAILRREESKRRNVGKKPTV